MSDESTTSEQTSENEEQVNTQNSGNASEESSTSEELTEEQKAEQAKKAQEKEEQDKRRREGLVKQQYSLLASDNDYTIDDVPERLRDDVIEYQKKVSEKIAGGGSSESNTPDVVTQVAAKLKLDAALEVLEPEEAEKAQGDYEELIKIGKTPDEALVKVKKLYDILSPEEQARQEKIRAMRAHKASGGSESDDKTPKPKTRTEKAFMKAVENAKAK